MSAALSLVGTGVGFGVVHVLTGPDHLSALATLSANVKSTPQAFCLGVRWGIGHSTGLLIVGMTLIIVSKGRGEDKTFQVPDTLTTVFEYVVGVFMLLLGAYGVRRAWTKRPGPLPSNDDDQKDEATRPSVRQTSVYDEEIPSKNTHSHFGVHHFDSPSTGTADTTPAEPEPSSRFANCIKRCTHHVSTRTIALLAGIVHGLAGPGGVLGVIPAVQLHDGKLAAIYLGCFCASSTLTMGIYATLYGACSSRIGAMGDQASGHKAASRDFWIESVSASLSIIVGILWLVLLVLGKLDDVFP